MSKNIQIAIRLIFISFLCMGCNTKKKHSETGTLKRTYTKKLNEIDGPYLYDKNDSISIVTVEKDSNSSYYIQNKTIKKIEGQKYMCHVNNVDKDKFEFTLQEAYHIPKSKYKQQGKLFVTSDIEGNFDAFYSLLVGNKIMDKKYNWIYGQGHLVICGDMVDRGNNAWPCLWLLYKLEQDAEKHGGKVHYVLGNHDVMNMHANLRYVKNRYIELAKILSGKQDEKEAWMELLSDTNEIVKWIASKNTIEKIGDALYVHGGISTAVVDAHLSIEKINDIVRKNIRLNLTNNPRDNATDNLVFSRLGPLWYRGLVDNYQNYYKKITAQDFDEILRFYDAQRIIIGHTIVSDEITSDFNGKVIRVDIKHPNEKFNGKSQGLLIENNIYYKVSDTGDKFRLVF